MKKYKRCELRFAPFLDTDGFARESEKSFDLRRKTARMRDGIRAVRVYFALLKLSLSRTLRLNTRCSAEQSFESMQK